MAADSGHSHRAGPLKQQNKSHKHGKHKTKGQMEKDFKGRVNVKLSSKKALSVQRKNDRRYQAQQLRKQKREEVMAKKRSIGSSGTPPHCVLVVPLHASVSCPGVVAALTSSDDTSTVTTTGSGITHMSIPRFKQRVEFVCTEYGRVYDALDGTKVSDSLLLVLDADEGLDKFGQYCLTCLMGQGMSGVTLVVQGLKNMPPKKQKETRKNLLKKLEKWLQEDKVHSLDSPQDGQLLLRHITAQKLNMVHYREHRPHLLAEELSFELSEESESHGNLKLTGYVRSQTLSVNRLVHLPGWGDFQLGQVDVLEDPYPLHPRADKQRQKLSKEEDTEMGCEPMTSEALSVLRPNPSRQEPLDSEVIPDPMEGEQTWPTEEELAAAEHESKKVVQRVPKGTSDYQASWIIQEDEDDVNYDEEDDMMDDHDMETAPADDDDESLSCEEDEEEEEEEFEEVTVQEDEAAQYDAEMDMDEEMRLFEKIKKEKQHVMFPDEVDTPVSSTARARFQKYRGLKSYRTSPWDRKENLPHEYARIFQFANFRRTMKTVLSGDEDEDLDSSVSAWTFVRLHIANVPKTFMDSYHEGSPVVVFGLLPHEQKMSVMNLVLRKQTDVSRPIMSKERMVFHVGFRRFTACPIFSQHTNANKHKLDKFLPQDAATVATVFAPITFPPAPVLVFQDRPFGLLQLVAKGSLLSMDPDRIVAKRVVLSGYPFKINKRSCVVRYMFFNRDDIMWFKPVEMRTKWGRRGHIKEPLGTHGHMKCVFDGQLKSQDTIMMNLYKRVFPKWTYSPLVTAPDKVKVTSKAVSMETIDEDEEDREGAAFAMFD